MAVKRQVIVGVASLAALYVGVSNALGLGEMRLDSSLNQPLSATIQLQDAQGLSASDVIVSLAPPDAFDRAGIDRPFFLTDLRFVPVVENNRLLIRVESTRPVREPYLNFLVELRRPSGRMLREYTVLLDPPLYEPNPVIASLPTVPQTSAGNASAPSSASPNQGVSEEPRTQLEQLPDLRPQAGAQQYTTQPGDSLWNIAVDQRPDGAVPIRINMSAIHALNPDAFVGGDIDKLRQGYTLTLPTRDQLVSAGVPSEVLADVVDTSGEARITDEKSAAVSLPGRDTENGIVDNDTASSPNSRPERLDAGADAESGSVPGAESNPEIAAESGGGRLSIEETTLDVVDGDTVELLGRLNALESQFNALLSELDARDAQIASLQAELEVIHEARSAEAELDGELAGSVGSGSIGGGSSGSGPSAAGGSDDRAAGAVAANVLPEDQVAPANATSWYGWLSLPLVFIAFLLGWLLSRRRQQEEETASLDNQLEPAPAGGFSSNITTVPAMVARPVTPPAPKPAVDPLDGVELYITYGRFAEARTMLDKAIDEEPQRLDLRYKQLRVLAELGDGPAFAEQEEEITELGGDLERIDQIKARFPQLFNDEGDVVEQVDRLEPLLDEEDNAEFRSGIEEEHDESNTSQLNLNDFTLDADWDLIDGLSPEPLRKSPGKETAADANKTISEEEFASSLHNLPQVEELDEDRDEHFSSTDLDEDEPRGNR